MDQAHADAQHDVRPGGDQVTELNIASWRQLWGLGSLQWSEWDVDVTGVGEELRGTGALAVETLGLPVQSSGGTTGVRVTAATSSRKIANTENMNW